MRDAGVFTFVPNRLDLNIAVVSIFSTMQTSGSGTQVKWKDAAVGNILREGIRVSRRDTPWRWLLTIQGLPLRNRSMKQIPVRMQCFLHVPNLRCGWRNLRPLQNVSQTSFLFHKLEQKYRAAAQSSHCIQPCESCSRVLSTTTKLYFTPVCYIPFFEEEGKSLKMLQDIINKICPHGRDTALVCRGTDDAYRSSGTTSRLGCGSTRDCGASNLEI